MGQIISIIFISSQTLKAFVHFFTLFPLYSPSHLPWWMLQGSWLHVSGVRRQETTCPRTHCAKWPSNSTIWIQKQSRKWQKGRKKQCWQCPCRRCWDITFILRDALSLGTLAGLYIHPVTAPTFKQNPFKILFWLKLVEKNSEEKKNVKS